MIKGSCLCGGIQFEIDGAVAMTRYCHCEYCRKFSGTAQAAWGLANTAEFRQTLNATNVGKFDVGTGSLRCFCSSCDSPLWFEPKDMPAYLGIALGAIDEGPVDDIAAPDIHLWVRSSPAWEQITDSLTQYETVPGNEGSG